MWTETESIGDERKSLIVLDFEGSNSKLKNQGHDAKIFALALLLSSLFIFNTRKQSQQSNMSNT